MKVIALVLSLASLLLGISALVEPRSRATVIFAWTKFLSNAWAPYLAAAGVVGAGLGVFAGAPWAVAIGLAGAALSIAYVWRIARARAGIEDAFGADWRARLGPAVDRRMVHRRWGWRVPRAPEARVTRNIGFARVPGTSRRLFCDVWQPAEGIPPSGIAIVYLHGSAWTLIDKDVGTRPFFHHLCAQGHVVMDVAYRLCPETDVVGMVADAKRAVAWIKSHAGERGARADDIVLMGSSAGAHVALLAAYTAGDPQLTPDDLRGVDTGVCAVVSYYGIPDMHDYDVSARRFLPPGPPGPAPPREPPGRFGRWLNRRMFGRDLRPENLPPPPPHHALMRALLGGMPDEVPAMYDLASPLHHVTAASPATMHLQGCHDQIAPLASARRLHRALDRAGVPAVFVEYPWTGHAFDLIVPPLLGPAGQAALHDVERFLACVGAGLARRPSQAPSAVGNHIVNRVPLPGAVSTEIRP